MTFADKLREKKSSLKQSSVDTYLRNIKRLRKVKGTLPIPEKDHKWLLSKSLLAWFDEQTLSVRRHLATGAMIALQSVYSKTSDAWKKRQSDAMTEFDEDRRKRKLTDKQKARMPSKGFDSLREIITTMKRELRHITSKKKEDYSLKDLLRVQELVIISLYYNFPLRLDYATLQTKKTDGNCIYKNTKKPKGWHIQLTEYKTSKSMGKKTFKPNPSNQRLLNKFVPVVHLLTKHGYLLSNQSKGKMTKQSLSKKLMAITKKRIGREFSVQLLRILYAMKNRDVIESAKEVSEKLLHSQEQSLLYSKKQSKD